MKSIMAAALFCLALGTLAANAAPQANPAMLTGVQGTAEVRRAGQATWQAASLMALLKAGDSLRTGEASSATVVFFADGHREKLLARTSGKVTATAVKPLRGSRRLALSASGPEPTGAGRILAFRGGQKLAAGYNSAAGRPGAIAMRVPFGLLLPAGLTIREGRPALKWTEKEGADTYRLRIFPKGQEPLKDVVSVETKATAVPYPEGAAALQPGAAYSWELDALAQDLSLEKSAGELKVMADASRRRLEREEAPLLSLARTNADDTTAAILLGCLYTKHDLLGEAIEQYRRALVLQPDDRGLHRELGWLCRQVGRLDEAREHFAAAGMDPADPTP